MSLLFLVLMSLLQLELYYSASDIKVAVVGSGNWGSAAARRIALNILDCNDGAEGLEKYNSTVTMWVYEEEVSFMRKL